MFPWTFYIALISVICFSPILAKLPCVFLFADSEKQLSTLLSRDKLVYPPSSRHWFLNLDKLYVVLALWLRKVTYSFFILFLCFQWAHAIVPTWIFIKMSTDITCTQKLWPNVLFHCLTVLPLFLALMCDHSPAVKRG